MQNGHLNQTILLSQLPIFIMFGTDLAFRFQIILIRFRKNIFNFMH